MADNDNPVRDAPHALLAAAGAMAAAATARDHLCRELNESRVLTPVRARLLAQQLRGAHRDVVYVAAEVRLLAAQVRASG